MPSSPDPAEWSASEVLVADLWYELLSVRPTRRTDDFYALGGYSLLLLRLADGLRRRAGVGVDIGDLFRAATVAEQAALLARTAAQDVQTAPATRNFPDADDRGRVRADEVLDATVIVGSHSDRPPAPAVDGPRHVLLTGATGFLGSFLLTELMHRYPRVRVTCLVRAETPAAGRERLERSAQRYSIRPPADPGRVQVVPGDLGQPGLGLGPAAYRDLSEGVDLVLHAGADVNLLAPYSRLRAANVLGTLEILRLAAPRALPVHFVSTSAVAGVREPGASAEADAGGYVTSKCVAEALVRQAGRRGLPTAVYRPGRISGHTVTGAMSPADAVGTVLRACLAVGSVPAGQPWDALLADLVPVDYVAAAIVHLACRGIADGTVYPLSNPAPTPVGAVLERLAALTPLERLSADGWRARMDLAAGAQGALHADVVAAALLTRMMRPDHGQVLQPPDLSVTARALAGSGIECPVVGPDVLDGYLAHLVSHGTPMGART